MIYLSDETLDVLFKTGRRAYEAERINNEANEHLRRAYEDYQRIRENVVDSIDDLNKRKIKVMCTEVASFVDSFSKIKNVNLNECVGLTNINCIDTYEIDYKNMSNEINDMYDFIISGMKSYAFGGIVLGEIIMSRKSKISYNNAKANEAAAKIEIEKIETEKVEIEAIKMLAKQQNKMIRRLAKMAKEPLESFATLVNVKTDWIIFDDDEKKMIASLMSLIKLIKLLVDQPVITSNGEICNEAYKVIEDESVVKVLEEK